MRHKGLSEDAGRYSESEQLQLGRILREWRQRHGLTLQQLQQKTAISHSVLSRIETGYRPVRLSHMEKLARVYGVPAADLMHAPEADGRGDNGETVVNLTVNVELLKAAKAEGVNLSRTLEQALMEALRQAKRDRWLAESREAIESYNRHIEKHGVFSDGLRRF